MELSNRKKDILKTVVEDYVRTAEPIGSKVLAEQMGGNISSATIRNELADLVDLGYLEQPHTSAGRIPTAQGYRLYVNELMEEKKLTKKETDDINSSLQMKMAEMDRIIFRASQAVSQLTRYPAYMLATAKGSGTVQRYELLSVDERSIIAVVMTDESRVKSQLIHPQLPVTADQLPSVTAELNHEFVGLPAKEMMQRLMSLSSNTAPALFMLLNQVIDYAVSTLEEIARKQIFAAGANQLLQLPEYQDIGKAQELMRVINEQPEILPLPQGDASFQIIIGPENASEALKDNSVIMATCDIGDDTKGLIGVVGPTRMDYATVTARLSYFAEGMTRAFKKKNILPQMEEK